MGDLLDRAAGGLSSKMFWGGGGEVTNRLGTEKFRGSATKRSASARSSPRTHLLNVRSDVQEQEKNQPIQLTITTYLLPKKKRQPRLTYDYFFLLSPSTSSPRRSSCHYLGIRLHLSRSFFFPSITKISYVPLYRRRLLVSACGCSGYWRKHCFQPVHTYEYILIAG